jgi:hypothetical protein
MLRNVVDYV